MKTATKSLDGLDEEDEMQFSERKLSGKFKIQMIHYFEKQIEM